MSASPRQANLPPPEPFEPGATPPGTTANPVLDRVVARFEELLTQYNDPINHPGLTWEDVEAARRQVGIVLQHQAGRVEPHGR
jgi:hypothetical protein